MKLGFLPAAVLILLLGAKLLAAPAPAWTPATQLEIAHQAARIAPADLKRQLDRHAKEYRRGVIAPFRDADPDRHLKNEDGSGSLDLAVREETERAIRAIESHRPFSEIVYRLGVVSHYLADANNPLGVSRADPREGSYFADYLRYVESAQGRFSVVFYGEGRDLGSRSAIDGLLERSLERGRRLYPSVGEEYRRVGRIDGAELFDDRSTAFGVAAVSFSHAVSDVAAVLRYIWITAGGADERALPFEGPRPQVSVRVSWDR